MTFWTAVAMLALVGGAIGYRRIRAARRHERGALTDDMIRQIEERGRVDVDEPLDFDEIEQEETRFWEESWDEPEEL